MDDRRELELDETLVSETPTEALDDTLLSTPDGASARRASRFGASDVVDGTFQLIRPLGKGGMGEVFIARDINLGRRVALKTVLLPERADDAQRTFLLQLFRRDATATAQLSHPNIVTIYHFGVHEDVPYMTLEFIDGTPLNQILSTSGPLPERQALRLMGSLARALAYAHARGVIHRDVKPENLMRSADGTLKVLDFGIALIRGAKTRLEEDFARSTEELEELLSHMPLAAGTPAYMAPEQRAGVLQSSAVDAWALGVTLFELVSGTLPELPDEPHADFRWPPTVDAHPRTRALVEACLRASPRERLSDLSEVASTLDSILAELDAAAPLTLARQRTNLREPTDGFVGREGDLATLSALFDDPNTSVVTLLGPVGVGKTRLATEWAHQAMASDPELEVFLIDLTDADDGFTFLQAIANGLDVPLTQEHPVAQLKAILSTRPHLTLLFDNAERALEPLTKFTTRGLDNGLPTRVLITSGSPSRIPRERIVDVSPIAPDSRDARELFEARAREASPGWSCPPHEEEALAALLAQLDGLPLAVELAAARVRALTPSAMLKRMNQRFALLRSSARDARNRSTLLEAMEWSWSMLDATQRALFAQLGVFEGGATLEAVEEVVDLSDHGDPFVLDVLEELVERSLLKLDPDTLRLDMLMGVRAFARRKLDAGEPIPDLGLRHARYYAQWVRSREGSVSLTLDASLDPTTNLGNVERARVWALAHGRIDLAARLSLTSIHILTRTGPLGRILDIADDFSAHAPPSTRLIHELRRHAALSTANTGQDTTAWRWSEDALADAIAHDDHHAHAHTLHVRAKLLGHRSAHEQAQAELERALELARTHHLDDLLPYISGSLGGRLFDLGDYGRGIPILEDTLRDARRLGLWDLEVRMSLLLAIASQNHTGDDSWRNLAHTAIARAVEHGNLTDVARWSIGVGFTELASGNLELAHEFLTSSHDAARRVGLQRTAGLAAGGLGEVALQRGELDTARALMLDALDTARTLADRSNIAYWTGALGELAMRMGHLDEAARKLTSLLEHAERIDHTPWVLSTQAKLGMVAHANGERDAAARWLDLALATHSSTTIAPGSEYVAPLITLCERLGVPFDQGADQ